MKTVPALFVFAVVATFMMALAPAAYSFTIPAQNQKIRLEELPSGIEITETLRRFRENLRVGPSIHADVVREIGPADIFLYLGERKNGWIKLQIFTYASMVKPVIGWTYGEFFGIPEETGIMPFQKGASTYVVTEATTMYKSPSPIAALGGQLAVGDKIQVHALLGHWLRIADDRWVYGEFAEIVLPHPTAERTLAHFLNLGVPQWFLSCDEGRSTITATAGKTFSITLLEVKRRASEAKNMLTVYMVSDQNAWTWKAFKVSTEYPQGEEVPTDTIERAIEQEAPKLFMYRQSQEPTKKRLLSTGCTLTDARKMSKA